MGKKLDETRATAVMMLSEIDAAWEAIGGDLTGDLPEAIRQLHKLLAQAREERDAAQACVAALEAVLAEPGTEEVERLCDVYDAGYRTSEWGESSRLSEWAGIRAILADLRQRAGVSRG